MPNRFDRLEARLHKSAARAFGYSVVWLPSVTNNFAAQTINGLTKDPNKRGTETELERVDYHDSLPILELYEGEFPGLHEAVNTGEHSETVSIDKMGKLRYYRVASSMKVHDGDTYYMYLTEVSPPEP